MVSVKNLFIFVYCVLWLNQAQAALVNGSVLDFTPLNNSGTYVTPADGNGSWFELGNSGYFAITSFEGLVIGSTQTATGSHAGAPDGSESPTISAPFVYYSQTAMIGTVAPSNLISTVGNRASIDFSGITWGYNGQDNILLYEPTLGDTGLASIVCALDCGNGDTYVLDYFGHASNSTAYAGTEVRLHFEGTISTVPVPAAIWLFGSGLIVLIAEARKKTR